jgi:hypothetical protein
MNAETEASGSKYACSFHIKCCGKQIYQRYLQQPKTKHFTAGGVLTLKRLTDHYA